MKHGIAALYCAARSMDYLESSVRSIDSSVELIMIGISGSSAVDQETLDRVQKLPGRVCEVELVRGDWNDTREAMNALAGALVSRGFSRAMIMSPEDVYSDEDLPRFLAYAAAHPEAGQIQGRFNNYWKSPLHRIDPPDPVVRTIISRISTGTSFTTAQQTNELPVLTAGEDTGSGHNFTFASPTASVVQRVQALAPGPQAIEQWKKQVWQAWNKKPLLRNLHPEQADRFRQTKRIHACTLPRALAGHRYLDSEIAGEQPRRKPVCSLIFVAGPASADLRGFVRNLALTVPDDCEIVGCARTEAGVSLLRQNPGIRAVRIAETEELHAAWIAGAAAAATDHFVFVTDRAAFEGDWVEGFIAALDQGSPQTVYAARTIISGPPPGFSGGDRDLLFEKNRGRRYAMQSVADQPFPLGEETCWACTRSTLARLNDELKHRQAAGEPAPRATRYVQLEDTLVFDTSGAGPSRMAQVLDAAERPVAQEAPSVRASIVIPVYNNLHLTRACLNSIFANTRHGSYEVIVVDNNSTDGSREYLEGLAPRIRYIRNRRNLFFGGGSNRGAWAARTENIVFLNNDTLVKPRWLDELLRPIDRDETVGIVGNKQVFPPSHPACANRIWHAGMVITSDGLPWHPYYGFDPQHPIVNRERECQAVTGCCFLIRTGLFERLGGFDPEFQNGFEDVDLCLRAGELGYRIVYTPRSELVHFVSSSESRFDRDEANLAKFKSRWGKRLTSDEREVYQDAGLVPAASAKTTRVGLISTFNQKCSYSAYAEQLVSAYPQDSCIVLAEFGIRDLQPFPDPVYVVRCWDRAGTWYYPLLHWARTLDLDLIHVNFGASLFPRGFLEVLAALRNSGKRIVITCHNTSESIPLLADLCRLADAVVVNTAVGRLELIVNGCDASKILVIPPGSMKPGPSSRLVKERLKIPKTHRLIVSNGFIEPGTGILETIAAVAELRKQIEVTYLVAGNVLPSQPESGRYLEQCRLAARELGLENRVFFLEDCPADEQADYLSAADAAVLFHRPQLDGSFADAGLALATARRVVTSAAPAFAEFGGAVLRAGSGIDLAAALYSLLTNPLLAVELTREAARYGQGQSWSQCADSHWSLYRRVLDAPGNGSAPPLGRYEACLSNSYPADVAAKLYRQLERRIRGDTIEFGSRSLELTQWILPRVSVASNPELSFVARALEIEVPVLTTDEFQASPFFESRFETILLHLQRGMDACVSMVLAILPHLSGDQSLLVLFDEADDQSIKLADQIYHRSPPHFRCTRDRIEPHHGLMIIDGASVRLPGKAPDSRASRSLVWSGSFYACGSSADAARACALALSHEGIEMAIENFPAASAPLDDRTRFLLRNIELNRPSEAVVRVDQHPDNLWEPRPGAAWNIARCQPRGAGLSQDELSRLRRMDSVWVSNAFHLNLCVNSGLEREQLTLIPNTLDFPLLQRASGARSLSGLRSFNFLSVFSWAHSSGWDLLAEGFLREFDEAEDVSLVLVVDRLCGTAAKAVYDQVRQFVRSHLGKDFSAVRNVILVTEPLGPAEVACLYKTCQAFVLPCRSSQWELPIMAAMACGLPVIATPWGPNSGLVRDENSYPIRYEQVRVPAGQSEDLDPESQSAEPSLSHLRELMRQVSQNPDGLEARTALARREIYENHSWPAIAAIVRRHMEEIEARLQRPARFRAAAPRAPARICWEGPQLVNHSLALVNREMELALLDSGRVDLSILPVGPDDFAGSLDRRAAALSSHYRRQLDGPIDVHVRHRWPPDWTAPTEGRWVVIQPWEYGGLPEEWVEGVSAGVDDVWAYTTFVRELYIQSGVDPSRVHVVPLGVDTEFFRPGLVPYPVDTNKSFKFLFLGGTIHRKGIDVLLRAYRAAFAAGDDVALVIKDTGTAGVYRGQGSGESIRQMETDEQSARIVYLDQDLTDVEIARLYNSCDCLVHPYRGEGFGLPVLEAMSCALPVIVTAGGATDDFVDDRTGFRIPALKQVFGNRVISGLRTAADLWLLEPALEALTEALIRVFQNREQARAVGREARAKVIAGWTWKHSAERALERIEKLRCDPPVRSVRRCDAAVLLDLAETSSAAMRDAVLESLQQNSYADLQIIVKADGEDFAGAMHWVRDHLRAPFFVLVTTPVRFSKHWLKQIADIAGAIGAGPKIIVPSINLEEWGNDEFSFQRFARSVWRQHRGRFQPLDVLPSGCAVLTWDCLFAIDSASSWQQWVSILQNQGIKAYCAQDTYVGVLEGEQEKCRRRL